MKNNTYENIIKFIALLGALGMVYFGLTAWLSPLQQLHEGASLTEGITIYSRYLAARNLPIAALLVYLVVKFDRRVMGYALLLMGMIQALDTIIGISENNVPAIIAPLVLSTCFFASSYYLLKKS